MSGMMAGSTIAARAEVSTSNTSQKILSNFVQHLQQEIPFDFAEELQQEIPSGFAEQLQREIPSEFAEQLKQAYTRDGAVGVKRVIIEDSNAWKQIKMDLAIIGAAGAGKSTLTNALCGCTSKKANVTKVSYIDGSKGVKHFQFPGNPNITLWDLPGVGTSDFTKEEYLKLVDIDKYDCFLVIVTTRFTTNDAWLADEIKKRKKCFCYVYTKIDIAVRNEMKEKRKNELQKEEEAEVVEEVRFCVTSQIQKLNIAAELFLIDSYQQRKYDFPKLQQTIIKQLPQNLQQALLLTFPCLNASMVKAKSEELKKRTWKLALMSGLVSALPIPGLSIAVDIAIINEEAQFYTEQFGLDDSSLETRAKILPADVTKLRKIVEAEFPHWFSPDAIRAIVSNLLRSITLLSMMAIEEAAHFVPFFGSFVAAPLSAAATRKVLLELIDKMERVSMKLVEYEEE